MLTLKTVNEFLDEVASDSPAPGGGSVSALTAALGTALTSMVCRLTIGRKKYADVQTEIEAALQKSEELRSQCISLIEEDTLAFNKVMESFALPKDTEEQRTNRNVAIQDATKTATFVPLRLMELCKNAIEIAKTVAEKGNTNSISDSGVAALMLQTACDGAALNVRINLKSLENKAFVRETSKKIKKIATTVESLQKEILARANSLL